MYLPIDNSILVSNEHGTGPAPGGKIKITKLDLDGNVISTKLVLDIIEYWPLSSDMMLLNEESVLVYFSSKEEGTSNEMEIQLKNLNADLTEVWSRSFSEIKTDIISDVIKTSDNNFVLLSMSTNIGKCNGEFDINLSKVDAHGYLMWRRVFGSTSSDQGLKVLEKMNNNLVIIGNSNYSTGSQYKFELILIETDSEGNPF